MTTQGTRPSLRRLLAGTLLGVTLVTGAVGWRAWRQGTDGAGRLGGDFHALQVLPGGRLLYGQHAGVSVSTDGGRTWGRPDGAGDALSLASSPRSPVLILAGPGVLKTSRDGGATWRLATFGNLASRNLQGFAVAPDAPNVWYANIAGLGLYRTHDGLNWEVMSPETANATALAAGPGSPPRLYALVPGEGLIASDDGTTWRRAGNAPPAAPAGLTVHPVSGHVYLAGPAGLWRSGDQGATWARLGFREAARLVAADPRDEARLYAVGASGAVYRSLNGGRTWATAGRGR